MQSIFGWKDLILMQSILSVYLSYLCTLITYL